MLAGDRHGTGATCWLSCEVLSWPDYHHICQLCTELYGSIRGGVPWSACQVEAVIYTIKVSCVVSAFDVRCICVVVFATSSEALFVIRLRLLSTGTCTTVAAMYNLRTTNRYSPGVTPPHDMLIMSFLNPEPTLM